MVCRSFFVLCPNPKEKKLNSIPWNFKNPFQYPQISTIINFMKQLEVYERISIILNLAQKKGGFTWEEISRKLENFYQMKGEVKMITKRTFQRDLQEIRDLREIAIKFRKAL